MIFKEVEEILQKNVVDKYRLIVLKLAEKIDELEAKLDKQLNKLDDFEMPDTERTE